MPTRSGSSQKPSSPSFPGSPTGIWADLAAGWLIPGATTIPDIVGSNDLTLQGTAAATSTDATHGTCLDPGTAGATMTPPAAWDNLTDFTFVVGIRIDADTNTSGGAEVFMGLRNTASGNDSAVYYWTIGDDLRARGESTGESVNTDIANAIQNDSTKWATVAAVFSATNGTVSAYVIIDGETTQSASTGTLYSGAFPNNHFGLGIDEANNPWSGLIEYGYVFGNDLTLSDIESIHTDPYSWSASDTNVDVSTKSFTLTEYAASISTGAEINVGTKSYTLTEYTASISVDHNISVASKTFTLTPYQATITSGTEINVGTKAFTLTTYAAAARRIDSLSDSISVGMIGLQANCTGLDVSPTTQTVTLGGQACTITNWNSGDPIFNVPSNIALKWGETTYQLVITDDTGSITLDNQTLNTRFGWVYKNYAGPTPGANEEGFYKASVDDLGITPAVGDQVQCNTGSFTIGDDWVVTIIPPNTVSGTYAVWDDSASTRSSESSFTFAEEPTLSSPGLTSTGTTTMDLSVTTDVDTGTLYWYISTSATPPSATDLKAGTGASDFGSIAISSTGAKTDNATGLSPSTQYFLHALHTNTVDSIIVTSSGVYTDSADVDVNVSVKTFTLTEYAASIVVDHNISVGYKAYTLTTYPASLGVVNEISVGTKAFTLTEYQATISYDVNVNVGTKNFTLTTYAASVIGAVNINVQSKSFNLNTYSATISSGTTDHGGVVTSSWRHGKNHRRIREEDKQLLSFIQNNMNRFMRGNK